MDFRLKVFHSVATNLSFTKASKELFISQPAISKAISKLEDISMSWRFSIRRLSLNEQVARSV